MRRGDRRFGEARGKQKHLTRPAPLWAGRAGRAARKSELAAAGKPRATANLRLCLIPRVVGGERLRKPAAPIFWRLRRDRAWPMGY